MPDTSHLPRLRLRTNRAVLHSLVAVAFLCLLWATITRREGLDLRLFRSDLASERISEEEDSYLPSLRADLATLASTHIPPGINSWKRQNAQSMSRLFSCLLRGDCLPNQTKIILISQNNFFEAFNHRWNGGEGIWVRSLIRSIERQNITYLYVPTDLKALQILHTLFPSMIKATFAWDGFGEACLKNKDCIRSPGNPHGLLLQDIFQMSFFSCGQHHPLGPGWCLMTERTGNTGYIGYEIEEECTEKPIIPHSDRPRRVWVLAKLSSYLPYENEPRRVWTYDMLERISKELNIEFVGAYENQNGQTDHPLIRNLGKGGQLPLAEFQKEMSNSLALLGMGAPPLSPTPWFSLCAGVPFINPSSEESKGDGWRQGYQHYAAASVGEQQAAAGAQRHVYNVMHGDEAGLLAALRDAIEPHPRYVSPDMTMASIDARMLDIVNRNRTVDFEEIIAKTPERWKPWLDKISIS